MMPMTIIRNFENHVLFHFEARSKQWQEKISLNHLLIIYHNVIKTQRYHSNGHGWSSRRCRRGSGWHRRILRSHWCSPRSSRTWSSGCLDYSCQRPPAWYPCPWQLEWVGEWVDRWMDSWMDERLDGWKNNFRQHTSASCRSASYNEYNCVWDPEWFRGGVCAVVVLHPLTHFHYLFFSIPLSFIFPLSLPFGFLILYSWKQSLHCDDDIDFISLHSSR